LQIDGIEAEWRSWCCCYCYCYYKKYIDNIIIIKIEGTKRRMSFVFRGTRSDIENGFPSFVPERRTLVILLLMFTPFFIFVSCWLYNNLLCFFLITIISVFTQLGLSIPIHLFFLSQVTSISSSSSITTTTTTIINPSYSLIVLFFQILLAAFCFIYLLLVLAVLLLFMILNSHQMSPNFLVFFLFF
jgi:hypothetical protein